MDSPSFPQTGWYLDSEWVEAFRGKITLEAFRSHLASVPHFVWGNSHVVNAELFYSEKGLTMSDESKRPQGPTPVLPQFGVWSDEEWARAFNEELKTFRQKVRKRKIPHHIAGNYMMVSAEDFYRCNLANSQTSS